MQKKQKGGIAPEKWAAVIAADGDKKLTVKSLIDGLRHLPEIAEVYAMLYADAEPGRPESSRRRVGFENSA